jgi:hypothetical protein
MAFEHLWNSSTQKIQLINFPHYFWFFLHCSLGLIFGSIACMTFGVAKPFKGIQLIVARKYYIGWL